MDQRKRKVVETNRQKLLIPSNRNVKNFDFDCFFFFFFFFENLAKISDNLFLIICNLEDAYFVKMLLMVASETMTYSEIYSPL